MVFAFNPVDYLEPALRYLCALLCRIIYPLIATMYELFVNISRLNIIGVVQVEQIYQRITLILAIIMVFYVTFEFVKYVVQPDKISDKEAGAANIVKKLILVILLIAFVPKIFTLGYQLQSMIIKKNVISKIVLGYSEENVSNLGNSFAVHVFRQFYYPDTDGNGVPDADGNGVNCDGSTCYDIWHQNVIDLQNNAKMPSLLQGINVKGNTYNGYAIHFDGLFAVLVGGVLCWMLLLYCVDIGTRWVQLIFLQVIAPIPIIGYLAPKKDNMFNKWVKQCVSVYLSLFIRILIIYFVLLISYILAHALEADAGKTIFSDISVSDSMKKTIYIFLILGLFTFAKRIPKMLEELFPKMGVATGSLGLKPGDRAGVARGVGMALGATTGLRTMVGRGINRARRNKVNKEYRENAINDLNRAGKAYDRFKRKNVIRDKDGKYTYTDEFGNKQTVDAKEFEKRKNAARVDYDSAKAHVENTKYRSALGAAAAGLVGGTVRGAATGAKLSKIDKFGDVRKQMQEVEKNENAKTAAVEKWYDDGGYSTGARVLSGIEQRVGVATPAAHVATTISRLDTNIKKNEAYAKIEADPSAKQSVVEDRFGSKISHNDLKTKIKSEVIENKQTGGKRINGVNFDMDIRDDDSYSDVWNRYKTRETTAEGNLQALQQQGASESEINAAEVALDVARKEFAQVDKHLKKNAFTHALNNPSDPDNDATAMSQILEMKSAYDTARSNGTTVERFTERAKSDCDKKIKVLDEEYRNKIAAAPDDATRADLTAKLESEKQKAVENRDNVIKAFMDGKFTDYDTLDTVFTILKNVSIDRRSVENADWIEQKRKLESSYRYSAQQADDKASGGKK